MVPLPFIVLTLFFGFVVFSCDEKLLEGEMPGPIVLARRICNLGSGSRTCEPPKPATLNGLSGSFESKDCRLSRELGALPNNPAPRASLPLGDSSVLTYKFAFEV